MSDDFDKDDLPWLQDDTPGDDDAEQDDALPAWLSAEDGEAADAPDARKLGFTSELPWMGDAEDAPSSPDSLGVTSMLEWRQQAGPDDVPDADAEFDVTWLQPAPDGEADTLHDPVLPAEVPNWLRKATDQLPDDERAIPPVQPSSDDEITQAAPDWVADDEDFEDDVPDWLAGPAPDATADWLHTPPSMVDADTGSLSDAWLAHGETLPQNDESELTFGEWLAAQEAAEREPDLEELTPDLESLATDDLPADVPATGALPDWLLGMDALDTSDAPEWFTDDLPDSGALTGAGDDWFSPAVPATDDLTQDGTAAAGPDFFTQADDEADPSEHTPETVDDLADINAIDQAFFTTLQNDSPGGYDVDTLSDDFFNSISFGEDEVEESPSTDPVNPELVPDGEFLQSLGIEDPVDWFGLEAEAEAPVPQTDSLTWLDELADAVPEDADAVVGQMADVADAPPAVEPDILAAPGLDNIDALLANMEDNILPQTSTLTETDFDFDDLLADPAFSDVELPADENSDTLQPESPDWLVEAGATVAETSAAAILRAQRDRELDELPDRLKRLRERGAALHASADGSVIPDPASMSAGLDTPAIQLGVSGVALTGAQQQNMDVLRSLTAMAQGNATPIFDDTPFMLNEDATLPEPEMDLPAVRRQSLRERVRPLRLVVALVLVLAIALPFFNENLRFGDLPPATFAAGSPQQIMYDSLAALRPGDRVLVGLEYGPTAAAELDSSARALLAHILLRGAQPVIVSQNPVALVRADTLLADLGVRDAPLQPNVDYYVTRYIAGEAVGLRALAANPAAVLAVDAQGQPNGLSINSLHDFAHIVVIVERPQDLRTWAEQVMPLIDRPLLVATGFSAAPLVEPYVEPGGGGLLVGYRDALSYATLLTNDSAAAVIAPVSDVTSMPDEAAPVDSPESTEESTPPPTDAATQSVTATDAPATVSTALPAVVATATPEIPSPTATHVLPTQTMTVPTETRPPTQAATQPPTETDAPATAPTQVMARVIASESVYVRSGPATTYAPVGRAMPGEEYAVLGRNADGSWIQIDYPDLLEGQAAWVAAFLVEISAEEVAALPYVPTGIMVAMAGDGWGHLIAQSADDATLPDEQPALALETIIPHAQPRWYAMNMGLIATVIIIAVGAVVNIARALLRRGN